MKKRIESLNEFVNANEEQPKLLEGALDEETTDPNITDEKTLYDYVMNNIGQAFSDLLKEKINLTYPVKAVDQRGYIKFDGRELSEDEIGLFKYGMKNVWIGVANTSKIPKGKMKDDVFTFERSLWFTLHYTYEHGAPWRNAGGSNGCALYLPKEDSSDIWYDITGKKFYTYSEASKVK